MGEVIQFKVPAPVPVPVSNSRQGMRAFRAHQQREAGLRQAQMMLIAATGAASLLMLGLMMLAHV